MSFEYSDDPVRFREQIRSFLAEKLPEDQRGVEASPARATRSGLTHWQRILDDQGLWLVGWPQEHGGTELTAQQRLILENELVQAGAPHVDIQSIHMVGPVVYTFGSDAQKAEFLPKIKRTDIWWCQGFSEPNAGSDLFSLKTRADRDGDDYVINGRKIWTSRAHWADYMFAILRTPGQNNEDNRFSFFLIDMKTPGITIRPIQSIDGNHHLNETIFDNVRVPIDSMIGEEGQGRTITRFLLTNERISLGAVEEIRERVRQMRPIFESNRSSFDESEQVGIAQLLNELDISASMLEGLTHKVQAQPDDLTASTLKILSTVVQQKSTEVMVQLHGSECLEFWQREDGLTGVQDLTLAQMGMMDYLFLRAASIYGGSNEVQHNIIYKMLEMQPG